MTFRNLNYTGRLKGLNLGSPTMYYPLSTEGRWVTFVMYHVRIYLVKSVSCSVNVMGGTEFPDGGIMLLAECSENTTSAAFICSGYRYD